MVFINDWWIYRDLKQQNSIEIMEDIYYIKEVFQTYLDNIKQFEEYEKSIEFEELNEEMGAG